MMENTNHLIEKFWRGDATAEERAGLLADLYQHNDDLKSRLKEEYELFLQSGNEQWLTEALKIALLKQIHQKIAVGKQEKGGKYINRLWPMIRMAAAILLVLLGFLFYPKKSADVQQKQAFTKQHKLPATITKRNRNTIPLEIIMNDGSIVKLYPNSTISYTSVYGNINRRLSLIGKAHFNVKKDAKRPFIVEANGYTTTALGTKFIISTLTDGKTVVELLTGKVVVRATEKSLRYIPDTYMIPGDKFDISLHSGLASLTNSKKTEGIKAAKPSAKKGISTNASRVILNFDKTPLSQVFEQIAANFNVPIMVNEANLNDLSFTGKFVQQDSREIILSVICQMNDLTYRVENGQVIINNK